MQTKLEIQEQTFNNISREIHDNIGLSLTLAKLNLNTLQNNSSDFDKIESSIELIGEALSDLSDISKSLNPEIINANGLIKVLDMEVAKINKTGVYNVKVQVTGEVKFLPSAKELVIYRIVQEALHNCIKHSKAKNIQISLHYNPGFLELSFCDDGIGFSQDEIICEDFFQNKAGLNNIQHRAKLIEGDCKIHSIKNKGTVIYLSVPINNVPCPK
jgi:signal transduction histidine kinase